jgi:ABC-type transport system substrate-binding protein
MPTSSPRPATWPTSPTSRSAPARSQFVDYQTDAVIRYKAFAGYWAGKVAIDDLIFAITTDPAVRAARSSRPANATS